MIIKDNMANMCAKVTSTYMEFTLAFGPKPEFSFSFKFSQSLDINAVTGIQQVENMFGFHCMFQFIMLYYMYERKSNTL